MSTKSSSCVTVSGFTVIPIKFSKSSKSSHFLYVKKNEVRGSSKHKPDGKTLFIVNVPPYCTEEVLKQLFSECGNVKKVYLQNTPSINIPSDESQFFPTCPPSKGFQCAYIVFNSRSSIKKAEEMPYGEPKVLSTQEKTIVTGIDKWLGEHKKKLVMESSDIQKLQLEIKNYMDEYDNKKKLEKEKEKMSEGMPDEDGWITVSKHGKNKGVPRTETNEKHTFAKEKKRRKEKELLNFYTFQARESKKEHIAELRKRFEDDKQKIALMRAARKFKPY